MITEKTEKKKTASRVNPYQTTSKSEAVVPKVDSPTISSSLVMDGTSVTEISVMRNHEFSQQIIGDTLSVYDLRKLRDLKKEKELHQFYVESKRQIMKQWNGIEALMTHSSMFVVQFMGNMGNVLNLVESSFNKKSEYVQWLRINFEDKHMRYFQQAKQIANIGQFAKDHAAAGKKRLLEIEHQRKVMKVDTCYDVFNEYPLPDMTEDSDGELLKLHFDTVITINRLKDAGIDFVEAEQAALISSFNKEAISVKTANDLKSWLNEQDEQNRAVMFDRFVMNKMTFPSDRPYQPVPRESLNKIIIDFVDFCNKGDFENEEWWAIQKQVIEEKYVIQAQKFIKILLEKMEIIEAETISDDNSTDIQ